MKKILFWILGIFLITIIWVTAAGFYKFNIIADDIYVKTESGNVVKYNDIVQISSSIIPISSVINTIGWEYVEVNTIVPAWVSPHGFDLSARQMAELSDDKVVFMLGLEHIDGFLMQATDEEKQLHLADGIELLESTSHSHDEHEDEHHDEAHKDEHEHEDEHHNENHEDEHMHEENEHNHSKDPHVWLGKDNIVLIAERIRDRLSEIMPEQSDYFAANTEKFKTELEAIYANFEENISGKSPKEFIVFHDAYNYLLESIGLNQNYKIVFAENVMHETGTAHIAELIEEIELHGVDTMFREPQFSTNAIQSMIDEYNINVLVLDPLGQDDSASGYLQNIQNNLKSLSAVYE